MRCCPKDAALMYCAETCRVTTVQPVDAIMPGRILVVDDDRPFGTFMLAALERGGQDVDPFLTGVGEIVAQAKRKRPARALRGGNGHSGLAADKPGTKPRARIDLVLYTSPASDKCQKAIRAIHQVLDRYNVSQVKFTICDVAKDPEVAEQDSIVFTPTLVKRGPGPRTWLIGNLDQPDLLIDLLDVSGVDRRRD